MKGPGNKGKLVARRVWECPVCQKQLFTVVQAVSNICPCQQDADPPQVMRLVKELPQKRNTFPDIESAPPPAASLPTS